MREHKQGFEIERVSADGLSKVEFAFRLLAGWGWANIRTDQLRYERRSRRCKWGNLPTCIDQPIPPDVRAEARERFHRMIDEMLGDV